ncbi:hypothetical protein [Streptomyces colonosanans]|uniref:hypothetical protein n=1 Tax=Streptomyces colonosanans TaxID=1428652 RepID=UPI0015A66B3A|nr:hypothetical protein [Streptomyces colonosanans]
MRLPTLLDHADPHPRQAADEAAGPEHRAATDGRIQNIHGRTAEIMEEIIGRSPLG